MCLNVFIDIVIEFHHHFLIVMFLPCTPTYTFFFTLYNDCLPNMLYHCVPFFLSCWSIPIFIQSIITFHINTSPHIPHSMSSLIARSIGEPKLISQWYNTVPKPNPVRSFKPEKLWLITTGIYFNDKILSGCLRNSTNYTKYGIRIALMVY